MTSGVGCGGAAPEGREPPSVNVNVAAPDMPNTDIFTANLRFVEGEPLISDIGPIAEGPGYENQPSFLPDGAGFLFTAQSASGKTDVFRHARGAEIATPVFQSPDRSEYSPRLSADGASITYIQENPDGDWTELHAMPVDGGEGKAAIDLAPLGYYAFVRNGAAVLAYLRSEPPTLHLVEIESGADELVATDAGRGLMPGTDGSSAYFTAGSPSEPLMLHHFDGASGAVSPMFALPSGSEFYVAFDSPGARTGFFSGDGSTLVYRTDTDDDAWRAVVDLAGIGVRTISRLAVNGDLTRILMVVERAE